MCAKACKDLYSHTTYYSSNIWRPGRLSHRKPGEERKTLMIKEDLVQKLNEIANKSGRTLYGLTNEIVETAIFAHQKSVSLREAVALFEWVRAARVMKFTIAESDLLYRREALAQKQLGQQWLAIWPERGKRLAKFLTTWFPGKNVIELLQEFFTNLIWDCMECQVTKSEQGEVFFRCVFMPELPPERVETWVMELDGYFEAIGYRRRSRDTTGGLILLNYVPSQQATVTT